MTSTPENFALNKNNMSSLDIDRSYLNRYVNDGFSGGEKELKFPNDDVETKDGNTR